ncbi:putative receptor-like protein kinase [Tanacetum coccineum]|uniref:Receptor-like protein kinase n=1 Tax=Tanacetum coccineum TaxID=301880 RepID=A0ABQ5AQA6_9ASTR
MKASNVLSDGEMNALIVDFGMARLFNQEESQADTSRTVGTNAHMASKYMWHGQFSVNTYGELEDGQKIAVKRLVNNCGKGNPEFKNEVLLVAKLQRRNLVRLIGFSIHGNVRLFVYELLPNESLDQFIFDPMKRALLDWEKRYKIIKGVVNGLLYLHEDSRLKIIRRDMKASNVLLDGEMNARIADFDMARLFKQEESQVDTSRIVRTRNYLRFPASSATICIRHGKFWDESTMTMAK